jgi:hypothetical protein
MAASTLAALRKEYRGKVTWIHSYPSRLYCTECGAEGGSLDHLPTCSVPALEARIEEMNRVENVRRRKGAR